jgi:5-methylcytosine-specific restriction endonuclease McrA
VQIRLTIEEISTKLAPFNIKLLGDYTSSKKTARFMCFCGNDFIAHAGEVLRGKIRSCGCLKRLSPDEVSRRINATKLELLDKYIDNKTKLRFKCYCGNIFKTIPSSVFSGLTTSCGCYRKLIMPRGKNHYKYNSLLTDYDREDKRTNPKYIKWKKLVFERDEYICQVCFQKGGKLNPHHLNSFHYFENDRYVLDNGITLCEDCHQDFHYMYGRKWNTKEEFKEYIKT